MREVNIKINTEGANKAVKDIDKVNDALGDTNDELTKVGDSADDLKKVGDNAGKSEKGLKKMSKGIGAMTKSLGIITLLAAAFQLVKSVLEEQQPVLDALETGMTAIQIAISAVSKAVMDTFNSTKDATGGFDAMKEVVINLLKLAITPMKLSFFAIKGAIIGAQLVWEKSFFGSGDTEKIDALNAALLETKDDLIEVGKAAIDSAISIKDNIGEAVDEASTFGSALIENVKKIDAAKILSDAAETTRLKNLAILRAAENEKLLQEFDERAEKLRQERDNINSTFEDRQKASEDLKQTLIEQGELMEANAQIVLDAALAEEKTNKASIELRAKRILAEKELADVKATVTGLETEQGEQDRALALEKSDSMAKAIADEVELANVAVESELLKTQAVIDGQAKQLEVYEKAGQQESQQYKDLVAEKKLTEAQKVELVKDAEEEAEEIRKEIAAQRREDFKGELDSYTQAAADSIEAIDMVLDEINEKRNQKILEQNEKEQAQLDSKFDGQLNSLQARADEELRIDGEVSEATQNAIIKANNDKLLAQFALDSALFQAQERADKEANKQKKKTFNANKALALATGIINTALAITSALTTVPYPLGIAMAVAAGAAGTLQTIAIANQKFSPTDTAGTPPQPPKLNSLVKPPIDTGQPSAGDLSADAAFNRQELSSIGAESVGGGAGQQQIKVVVQEADITQSQSTVNTIVETAEFGA